MASRGVLTLSGVMGEEGGGWPEWLQSEQTWVLSFRPVQDSILVTASTGCGLVLHCHSYHSHRGTMAAVGSLAPCVAVAGA